MVALILGVLSVLSNIASTNKNCSLKKFIAIKLQSSYIYFLTRIVEVENLN